MDLSNPQIKFLRKLGADLSPSIWIGKEGVNDGIIKNTRLGLIANELVKIKVNQNTADGKDGAFSQLAEATGAELVQVIGRTALLYKHNPDKPKIELP
jgi:RNA-binding protein